MKSTNPNTIHPSCCVRAAPASSSSQLLAEIGALPSLFTTFSSGYFLVIYPWHRFLICLFTTIFSISKFDENIFLWWPFFPRLMALFKIFAISANPTMWRTVPLVLRSGCEARRCGGKCLLCFLVVACRDTGQSLIEGGYHISFPHAKHLIQVFYSQKSPSVDFRTFSGFFWFGLFFEGSFVVVWWGFFVHYYYCLI